MEGRIVFFFKQSLRPSPLDRIIYFLKMVTPVLSHANDHKTYLFFYVFQVNVSLSRKKFYDIIYVFKQFVNYKYIYILCMCITTTILEVLYN